ncbi:MAG: creatininase family protein [Pseudomonadota bacterium]
MTAAAKHRLAELTFREFEERLADPPVIVIPLGSQEEQGPTCPMGDYQLTEVVADRAAQDANAVVAPILPFGYADYFRPVPGGIALRAETFIAVLEDIIVNFLDHGLSRIVILNGHSGNAPLIDVTQRRLKHSRGVIVPAVHLWRSIPPALFEELYGEDAQRAKGHGADPLTSVAMHLVPDQMRLDLAETAGPFGHVIGLPTSGLSGVIFQGVEVSVPVDVTDRCNNGITGGDPSLASADKGARIVDHLVGHSVALINHMKATDPHIKPAIKTGE